MASYKDITNTLNFAVSLKPSTAFPLDARSMFGSLSKAQAAAATAENAGSSNTVYYIGQILTVFENDVVKHYTIEADKTLKEVGSSIVGDNKTIVLKDNVVSMKSFGEEYYAYHHADNIIDGSESSYPDHMPEGVEGAFTQVAGSWYKYSGSSWTLFSDRVPSSTSYYTLTHGWKAGLEPKVVSTGDAAYAIAWYEPSETTVEGLQSIVGSLQTEVDGLTSTMGVVSGKVTANESAISEEVARATGAEEALDGRLTTAEGAITTLNGDAMTEGSVKKQVADAVAKIVGEAPEAYDTLVEISTWITTHSDSAAAMNKDIQANKTAISALETLVGTLPEGAKAVDVIGYIAEAVKVETDRATAAEGALSGRLDAVEATTAALGTAANKNVEFFATAEQGAKADSAVQSVTAGVNGHITVDGSDITVYAPTVGSAAAAGIVKVDGTSITADEGGTISVAAVDHSKVTGLGTQLESTKTTAVSEANTYADENMVAKTDVVASGSQAETPETASDVKVASEKLLIDLFTWKETM